MIRRLVAKFWFRAMALWDTLRDMRQPSAQLWEPAEGLPSPPVPLAAAPDAMLLPATDNASGTVVPISPYWQAVLDDTPYVFMPLANGPTDVSGHGYNGTATNVTWNPDPAVAIPSGFIGVAQVTGNGYVTLPSTVNPSGWTQLSVEVWVAYNGTTTQNPRWVANGHTDTDGHGFEVFTADTVDNPTWAAAGTALATDTGSAVSTGMHQLIGTFDGTTNILYLDGVAVASALAQNTTVQGSAHPIAIGYNPSYSGDYVNGWIAAFSMYSGTLSPARASAHYHAAFEA
jgi:hypothetical protein